MKKIVHQISTLIILFLVIFYPETIRAQEVKTGEVLFNENCASCHDGSVPKAPHVISFNFSSPQSLLTSMTDGVMKQQSAHLLQEEKTRIANYLSGTEKGETENYEIKRCRKLVKLGKVNSEQKTIKSWGFDERNTRKVSSELSGLNIGNVSGLKLKWAFAFPGATRARSQPVVHDGVIYVGSQHGEIYAIDLDTGCTFWSYQAQAEVRSAISIVQSPNLQGDGLTIYFGDFNGAVYALNGLTGEEIWKTNLNDHKDTIITGSPKFYNDVLYVPMSSNEWASAADPSYECCSFRGGVAAFHAKDGSLKWKSYSILEVPKDTGKRNPLDVPILAPSGVPVWNSPTIDVKRQLLYVGTGESYTSPAAPTSDAVLAFSLSDGKMVWHKQLLAGDAWNMSCFIGSNFNCPEEDGPDMDIGASVILIEDEKKGDVIVVGQKNGVVHGLSPDNSGKIIWQTKIGVGGYAGGVHWGMAADGSKIFAPNADTNFIGRFKDEDRRPGLYAIDAFSGEKIWYKKALDQCKQEDKPACDPGLSAAVSATDGLVFAGGFDGIIKAYNAMDGNILWQYNTNQSFNSISGHHAYGGSIESDGPVLYKGHVLVNSGYLYGSRMAGNVLLNFSID